MALELEKSGTWPVVFSKVAAGILKLFQTISGRLRAGNNRVPSRVVSPVRFGLGGFGFGLEDFGFGFGGLGFSFVGFGFGLMVFWVWFWGFGVWFWWWGWV